MATIIFRSTDLVVAFVDGGYEIGPRLVGDYNRNGSLDAGELDLQAIEMVKGEHPAAFDLNGDGLVDFADREIWVNDLKKTWMGDANLDMEFNSTDWVQVLAAGKYETGDTATWEEGDFTGNMRFTSSDFVAAFPSGMATGSQARYCCDCARTGAVVLLAVGLILAFSHARRRDLG